MLWYFSTLLKYHDKARNKSHDYWMPWTCVFGRCIHWWIHHIDHEVQYVLLIVALLRFGGDHNWTYNVFKRPTPKVKHIESATCAFRQRCCHPSRAVIKCWVFYHKFMTWIEEMIFRSDCFSENGCPSLFVGFFIFSEFW